MHYPSPVRADDPPETHDQMMTRVLTQALMWMGGNKEIDICNLDPLKKARADVRLALDALDERAKR